jgi:hypothetical protein
VRSRGEPVEDLDYWLELGYVGGRDGSKSIGGWGVDLGTTYEWPLGPRPSVTLGFAFGSGDRNADDQRDGSFRQTGLQKNEWDFGGSTDFKVYGEVLDPELSNLAIFTVGALPVLLGAGDPGVHESGPDGIQHRLGHHVERHVLCAGRGAAAARMRRASAVAAPKRVRLGKTTGATGVRPVAPGHDWSGRPDSNRRRPAWEIPRRILASIPLYTFQELDAGPRWAVDPRRRVFSDVLSEKMSEIIRGA